MVAQQEFNLPTITEEDVAQTEDAEQIPEPPAPPPTPAPETTTRDTVQPTMLEADVPKPRPSSAVPKPTSAKKKQFHLPTIEEEEPTTVLKITATSGY